MSMLTRHYFDVEVGIRASGPKSSDKSQFRPLSSLLDLITVEWVGITQTLFYSPTRFTLREYSYAFIHCYFVIVRCMPLT